MAAIANMNFPDVERGDYFPQVTFTPDFSLVGWSVEMLFKYVNVTPYKTITTSNGLVVTDAFIVFSPEANPIKADWPKGVYNYELKLMKDGITETHFKGTVKITD